MTVAESTPERRTILVRLGFRLDFATLCWNVVGIVVLAVTAIAARSVALAGFGLDWLDREMAGSSMVVIWELSATGEQRQRRGLRLIGGAFAGLGLLPGRSIHCGADLPVPPSHKPSRYRLDGDHCVGHVRSRCWQGPYGRIASKPGAADGGQGHPRRRHPIRDGRTC